MAGLDNQRVMAELEPIFRKIFKGQKFEWRPSLSAFDVEGWDSFKHIEIIIAVESEWAVEFEPDEVAQLRSVGDLAELVIMASKRGAG
jgi:acyl carrier protein